MVLKGKKGLCVWITGKRNGRRSPKNAQSRELNWGIYNSTSELVDRESWNLNSKFHRRVLPYPGVEKNVILVTFS